MNLGIAHAVWSLAILGAFVVLVAWIWSGRRKGHFEEAGRIPFREDRADEDPHPRGGE